MCWVKMEELVNKEEGSLWKAEIKGSGVLGDWLVSWKEETGKKIVWFNRNWLN